MKRETAARQTGQEADRPARQVIACIDYQDGLLYVVIFTGDCYLAYTNILDTHDSSTARTILRLHSPTLCLHLPTLHPSRLARLSSPSAVHIVFRAALPAGNAAVSRIRAIHSPAHGDQQTSAADPVSRCLRMAGSYLRHRVLTRFKQGSLIGYYDAFPVYVQENYTNSMALRQQCLDGLHILKPAKRGSAVRTEPFATGHHTKKSRYAETLFGAVDFTLTVQGRDLLRLWLSASLSIEEEIVHRRSLQETIRPHIEEVYFSIKQCRCSETHSAAGMEALASAIRGAFRMYEMVDYRIRLEHKTEYAELLRGLGIIRNGEIVQGASVRLDRLRGIVARLPEYLNAVASEISNRRATVLKVAYFPQLGFLVESASELENRQFSIGNKSYYKTVEMEELDGLLGDVDTELQATEEGILNGVREQIRKTDLSFLLEFIALLDALSSMVIYSRAACGSFPVFGAGPDGIRVGCFTGDQMTSSTAKWERENEERNNKKRRAAKRLRRDIRKNIKRKGVTWSRHMSQLRAVQNMHIAARSVVFFATETVVSVGHLVILAQSGHAVPFERACLPLFDSLLYKPAQSASLSRGWSTFVSEVASTAEAVSGVTPGSLCLLVDPGRGTNTADRLRLFFSVTEYLSPCVLIVAASFPGPSLLRAQSGHSEAIRRWTSLFTFYAPAGGRPDSHTDGRFPAIARLPMAPTDGGTDKSKSAYGSKHDNNYAGLFPDAFLACIEEAESRLSTVDCPHGA